MVSVPKTTSLDLSLPLLSYKMAVSWTTYEILEPMRRLDLAGHGSCIHRAGRVDEDVHFPKICHGLLDNRLGITFRNHVANGH